MAIGLTTTRDSLYKIIDNRVDKMIEDGLIDEVEELYKKTFILKLLTLVLAIKNYINILIKK